MWGNNREPPSNVAAEVALLGSLLNSNAGLDMCSDLQGMMFHEQANGCVFDSIRRRVETGRVANPITLKASVEPLVEDASAYMAELITRAAPTNLVAEYAASIRDCYVRRRAIETVNAMLDGLHSQEGTGPVAAGVAALDDLMSTTEGGAIPMSESVERAISRAERAARGDAGAVGLDTGIAPLDKALCGLHAGSLTIIAARPGEGKSALSAQILRHVASVGIPSLAFSMEMSEEDIGTINLAALSRVPPDVIRGGRYSKAQAEALVEARHELYGMPIQVDCRAEITLSEALAETRVAVRRRHIRLAVFDHRDLFARDPGHEKDHEIVWYRHVTRRLKAAAKSLGIAVVVLVQLSKDIERRDDKRPRKADLYGAGEQDADDILMIFRPDLHAPEEPKQGDKEMNEAYANRLFAFHQEQDRNKGVAQLYLVKRRFGPPGMVSVLFDGPSLSFTA